MPHTLNGASLDGTLGTADAMRRLAERHLAAGRRLAARRLAERYLAAGRTFAYLLKVFGHTNNRMVSVICYMLLSWLHAFGWSGKFNYIWF